MEKQRLVTLFVGQDSDSEKAVEAVKAAGIAYRVVDCRLTECDFDTPLLISSSGVFDSLTSIVWFGQLAAQEGDGS